MINPPFRGPREKAGGLHHFARLLDKIRLDLQGNLPAEYHPNLGHPHGLDGHLCGFLGIEYQALREQVSLGGTDAEIVEWCFTHGLRPNPTQRRIWNDFSRKFGWNDRATPFIEAIKAEDGLSDRADLVTSFDAIEAREGRTASPDEA